MKVAITANAEADLEAIGDWTARDNPRRAVSFIEELRAICIRLAETPKAYPVVMRRGSVEIHRRLHRDYLIFYRIAPARIEILHVLHGTRDYSAIFSRDFE